MSAAGSSELICFATQLQLLASSWLRCSFLDELKTDIRSDYSRENKVRARLSTKETDRRLGSSSGGILRVVPRSIANPEMVSPVAPFTIPRTVAIYRDASPARGAKVPSTQMIQNLQCSTRPDVQLDKTTDGVSCQHPLDRFETLRSGSTIFANWACSSIQNLAHS